MFAANAAGTGAHKIDALKSHTHIIQSRYGSGTAGSTSFVSAFGAAGNSDYGPYSLDTSATGSAETAPAHTRVAPVILI